MCQASGYNKPSPQKLEKGDKNLSRCGILKKLISGGCWSMAITIKEVEYIARLANLEFSPEEKERFTHQLSQIIDYMGKLQQLDTEGVEPTSHIIPVSNVFREDRVRPSLPREDAVKNAPDKGEGFVKVPKFLET